jgi:hypothetical protein
LSTANGEGNIFHQLWVGSQTGNNRFTGVFFPWSAGDRDEDWYEAKKRDLPDWQLAQEYPDNAEEAFIRSGRPVFDLDALRAIELIEPDRGYLKNEMGKNNYTFIADGGELAIWEFPDRQQIYVVGADVAEGLGHGDYSSAHVISANTGLLVAHWHGHVDPDVFGEEVLRALGYYYNHALVGVESNNHGLTTIKGLQRIGYRNLYRQRKMNSRSPKISETMGWRTTSVSKPLAIDELNAAIRDESVHVHDKNSIGELRTFIRQANGKMHGSPHDDRVMSLAITNQMLKYVWLPEYRVDAEPVRNTLGWWEKFLIREKEEPRTPIGAFNVRE